MNSKPSSFKIFTFRWLILGIPPPPVDIISILKKPTLFNKPLYGNDENESKGKGDDDLNAFFKAMGWTDLNGVLPKKPEKKTKKGWQIEDIDLNDVHKDLTKTDVEKEMRSSVLKGIEIKKDLKVLSEREAHRQRKVNNKQKPNTITDEQWSDVKRDSDTFPLASAVEPDSTHFHPPLVVSWCFSLR